MSQRRNIHRGWMINNMDPGNRQARFVFILYHVRFCGPGPVALRFLTIKWLIDNYFLGRSWGISKLFMKNIQHSVWLMVVSENKN